MTLEIRYHPEALAELRADVAWYDDRGAGLGERFENSVDAVVDAVATWPDSGAVWPGWDTIPVVRSRRIPSFPYRLVYLVLPDELVVIALAPDKRRPGYWRERVDTSG